MLSLCHHCHDDVLRVMYYLVHNASWAKTHNWTPLPKSFTFTPMLHFRRVSTVKCSDNYTQRHVIDTWQIGFIAT